MGVAKKTLPTQGSDLICILKVARFRIFAQTAFRRPTVCFNLKLSMQLVQILILSEVLYDRVKN